MFNDISITGYNLPVNGLWFDLEAHNVGIEMGSIDFNVSYQRPEYNGNESLIHWMSDMKINPFN